MTSSHHHFLFPEVMRRDEGDKDPNGAHGNESIHRAAWLVEGFLYSCPFQGPPGVSISTEPSPLTFRDALLYLPDLNLMYQHTSGQKKALCLGKDRKNQAIFWSALAHKTAPNGLLTEEHTWPVPCPNQATPRLSGPQYSPLQWAKQETFSFHRVSV